MRPLHQSLAKNYGKQQQHIAYDAYGDRSEIVIEIIAQSLLFTAPTFLRQISEALGEKVGCLSPPPQEDHPPERGLFLAIWCSGAQEAQAYASDRMP